MRFAKDIVVDICHAAKEDRQRFFEYLAVLGLAAIVTVGAVVAVISLALGI